MNTDKSSRADSEPTPDPLRIALNKAADTFEDLKNTLALLGRPLLAESCRVAEAATRAALASVPAPDSAPKPACWYCGTGPGDECDKPFRDVPCRRSDWSARAENASPEPLVEALPVPGWVTVNGRVCRVHPHVSKPGAAPDGAARYRCGACGNDYDAEDAGQDGKCRHCFRTPDGAASLTEPAEKWPPSILEALKFYADGGHFVIHDNMPWDTVSGEPANFYEHDDNSATVEDGSIARAALAAKPEPTAAIVTELAAMLRLGWACVSKNGALQRFHYGDNPGATECAYWDSQWPKMAPHRIVEAIASEVTGLQALPSEPRCPHCGKSVNWLCHGIALRDSAGLVSPTSGSGNRSE